MYSCMYRYKQWAGSLYLEFIIVVTSDRMGRKLRLGVMDLLGEKIRNKYNRMFTVVNSG